MNAIKKISGYMVILFALATVLPGCKKYLDRQPLKAILNDLNQGGLEGQAIGLYGAIRNSQASPYCGDGFVSIGYLPMQSFRSGDQTVLSDPGAAGYVTAYSNFQYSKDDWANGIYWDRHYQLIQLANNAQHVADSLKLTDGNSLINIGEIKWFRAYSYFDLVKNYGQVPLFLKPINTPAEGALAKSPVSDVYAQIDADLTYAEQHLPLSWPSTYKGRLTQGIVNAYEPGDPREAATILFSGQSDDPSNGGYGRTLPPLTNSPYWNKKTYTDPAEQLAAGDPTGSAFVNQRVFRYADVILMAAECANELGNGSQAESLLEQVRARARNGNSAVLPFIKYTSQAQFRAAIKQERRVEFGMEMERFYDLVRWGDAQTVLGGLGYQPKNQYYPIPTPALGANPKLVQNPNY